KLAFTTQPSNSTGGTAFTTQPVVKVEDASSNIVTTDSTTQVTLVIGTNAGPGGILSGCASNPITVSSGVATFASCKIDKSGNGYTLTTTNGLGLTNNPSAGFNITVGPATQLAFTSSPGNTVSSAAFATQPVVKVEDAGGNVVTTD